MSVFLFSLIVRGDKDEHAVLCSEDKTYDLKIADTSNLLLFLPGCKTPDQLPDISASPQQLMHAQVTGESFLRMGSYPLFVDSLMLIMCVVSNNILFSRFGVFQIVTGS